MCFILKICNAFNIPFRPNAYFQDNLEKEPDLKPWVNLDFSNYNNDLIRLL